jgi:hypothetical protein
LAKFPVAIGAGDESEPDRPAVAKEGSGVIPVHTRRERKVTDNFSRVGRRPDAYCLGPAATNPRNGGCIAPSSGEELQRWPMTLLESIGLGRPTGPDSLLL